MRDLLAFLGFANFYHIFIEFFSYIALPLMELTKGNMKTRGKTST